MLLKLIKLLLTRWERRLENKVSRINNCAVHVVTVVVVVVVAAAAAAAAKGEEQPQNQGEYEDT